MGAGLEIVISGEGFGKIGLSQINSGQIEANIEHTRFPVPQDEEHANGRSSRASTCSGSNRPARRHKLSAQDVRVVYGVPRNRDDEKLKYNSPADLRANYPQFFWQVVRPYIKDALRYLRVTQEGKQWIANLYANVFSTEHKGEYL